MSYDQLLFLALPTPTFQSQQFLPHMHMSSRDLGPSVQGMDGLKSYCKRQLTQTFHPLNNTMISESRGEI